MEKRKFGKANLFVTPVGFGAGHTGDYSSDEKEIEYLLNQVLDAGINLIDTAKSYGASEERIGKYLSHRRTEFVLSTKIGYGINGYLDWTYDIISAGVDHALKLFRTDYIDIVHLHTCPIETLQRGEVTEALLKVKEQGKIISAAYSGDNEPLLYAVTSGKFDSIQTSINIADQRNITFSLPLTQEKGMGVIAKRPIANAPWRFKERPVGHYSEPYWERLKTMELDFGEKWQETAIRYTAYTKGVHSAIIGTKNIEHLRQNIEAVVKGPLPEDDYNTIRTAFIDKEKDWIGLV